MSTERNPTSYLSDDWGLKKGGDPDSDANVPYRTDVPSPEWGGQSGVNEDNAGGGYGHSDDVKFDAKASVWGMSKDEVAKGYEAGEADGQGGVTETRQPYGSNPQAVPATNEWDRTHPYADERKSTTGVYDGTGSKFTKRTGFGSSSPTG
jgi:hypothetical protein